MARHLRRHDEQDLVPIVAAGLYRRATPAGRTDDQDSGGDGPTFAGHRSGDTCPIPNGGVFPHSHQTDAKIVFGPQGLFYRTIQQIVKQVLHPRNPRSWITLRRLGATERTHAGDHARLHRHWSKAVAVVVVLYESRAEA